jgi:hypothetical protein
VNLIDLLYSFEPHFALAVVTGLSVILYALFTNLAWINRQPHYGRVGRLLAWGKKSRLTRVGSELARWIYFLATPWLVLMLGYGTMRTLGIWGMDWLEGSPYFAFLSLGALLVLVWVWRPYIRAEHANSLDESGWNWARHIVEGIYQEAHWAFYRCGPILWLNDFYWGSFFGLAIALIENWSNPAMRESVHVVAGADAPLWKVSLAIVSTIIFIFTQNVWYCLVIHLILDLVLRGVIGFPRAQAYDD